MWSVLGIFFVLPAAFAWQVFLDAGHGGDDRGASRGKITESAITLSVTKKVGEELKLEDPGIKISYSRTTDVYRSLEERVNMANHAHPNLVVSIHVNSSTDSAAQGQEIYFQNELDPDEESMFLANLENQNVRKSSEPNEVADADPAVKYENADVKAIVEDLQRNRKIQLSGILSEKLHENWLGDTVLRRRSIRQAPFYVISNVSAPAALIEIGYLTNPNESRLLLEPTYQTKIARGIADAIIKFEEFVDKHPRHHLD